MKNKIKITLVLLVTVNGLFASQVKQKFAASIFWQVPIASSNAQFMFSDQNPVNMEAIYAQKDFSLKYQGTGTWQNVNNAVNSKKGFSQYIEGPYFSAKDSLYITHPDVPPVVKGQDMGVNFLQVRLNAIGKITSFSPYVSTLFPNVRSLFMLLPAAEPGGQCNAFIVPDGSSLIWDFVWGSGSQVSDAYAQETNWDAGIAAASCLYGQRKTWEEYNPKNAYLAYVNLLLGYLLSKVCQSANFQQKANLTAQSFGPVSGVKMQGSTYFKQDDVLFALHLITPGRTTPIIKDTSLADVMSQQNTYPDMYPLEGVTTCGDNFGF